MAARKTAQSRAPKKAPPKIVLNEPVDPESEVDEDDFDEVEQVEAEAADEEVPTYLIQLVKGKRYTYMGEIYHRGDVIRVDAETRDHLVMDTGPYEPPGTRSGKGPSWVDWDESRDHRQEAAVSTERRRMMAPKAKVSAAQGGVELVRSGRTHPIDAQGHLRRPAAETEDLLDTARGRVASI